MRLFAALTPPDHVARELDEFLGPRRDADPEVRWTDPQQWHVTLAFMGAAPERTLDTVIEAIAAAAATHPVPRLRLHRAGAFPDVARARVLWTGVEGDLDELARRVRAACSHAGAAPQGGRFHAHLTVGRLRSPVDATRWVRVLETYSGPAWDAPEISVVASHAAEVRRGRGHRRRYEVLAVAPLGGGSSAGPDGADWPADSRDVPPAGLEPAT